MDTPHRFVPAADGTPIAYRVRGSGPPLVLANGVTTSDFFWKYVLRRWTRRWSVITWDYKGHGRSGPARDPSHTTIPALVDDLGRVLDALDVKRAPIVGFSMGSQVALESVRAFPGRMSAAVSLLGPAGRLFDTALPPFTGRTIQRLLQGLPISTTATIMTGFGLGLRIPVAPQLGRLLGYLGRDCRREDVELYIQHFAGMHHPTVRSVALHGGDHDAHDLLPAFPVPLLIIAGERDPFAPAKTVGAVMHARAPGSRLYSMAHGTHTSLFEHHEELAAVVEDFLVEAAVEAPRNAS